MNILDRLSALFSEPHAPEIKPLPPTDVPHALGALLVRVAKSDDRYAVEEISLIDRVLATYQEIGPIEAAKLRAECERLEAFAPDTPEFAIYLSRSVSYEDRQNMVQALWQVVYADGRVRDVEASVMNITQSHLGISAEDCTAARARAQHVTDLSNS